MKEIDKPMAYRDKASWARSAGKQRVESLVAWRFEAGGIRARCLAAADDFELQIHDGNVWAHVTRGGDATDLLRRFLGQPKVAVAMISAAGRAQRTAKDG